jgi:ribosomal protein S18 acetylase RimI-like enzyme
MKVYEPKSKEDFDKYYDLRWRILRKPWNQPIGSEKDDLENSSIHVMVCKKDRIPIGVGRAYFNSPEEAQIRYMAVEENYLGKGVGSLILRELEKRIKEKGGIYVVLNARESAVDFYKKHGYDIVEKAHTLFGSIPHFKMQKNL